jgi:hypothetical protein
VWRLSPSTTVRVALTLIADHDSVRLTDQLHGGGQLPRSRILRWQSHCDLAHEALRQIARWARVVSMGEGGAGRVFISYRRQETAWPARQLYDLLAAELGADRVFKDVDNIEPGDDFVERVESAVASCDVLLALIGPQWLTITDSTGARRLDDPEDFVRLEVETALTRDDIRVIPILVDNAKMPSPQELPQALAALTRRQAVEINPVNFDIRRLLRVLNNTFERRPRGKSRADGSGQYD